MSSRSLLFAAGCAAMFIFGVVLAMPGALFGIAEFRARAAVGLAQQGNVFLALYGGVLVSTLIAGPAIDSYGNKPVLAICAAIAAISMALFNAGLLISFALGLGGGALNTSANALVAEIYDDVERPPMLNIVQMFFGAGALSAALLVTHVPSRVLVASAGAFIAVCAAAYATLRFPPPRVATGFSLWSSLRAARLPGVMILAMVCFCESGDEASIGGFISTYAGPGALIAYLLPFTLSRLAASRIRVRPVPFVFACALLSSLGCAFIVASPSLATFGATIAGIAVAPIYPAVLSLAAARHKEMAGTVFGLMFAVGLSGAVLFPFIVGHVAGIAGMRVGMLLPLIGGIAIAAMIYAGNRTSKTAPPPSALAASTTPP